MTRLYIFFKFFLSFKYSCLHFPTTTLPCPTRPHLPPSILFPFWLCPWVLYTCSLTTFPLYLYINKFINICMYINIFSQFTVGFILGVIHSVGLEGCLMPMYLSLQYHIEQFHCPKYPPHSAYSSFFLPNHEWVIQQMYVLTYFKDTGKLISKVVIQFLHSHQQHYESQFLHILAGIWCGQSCFNYGHLISMCQYLVVLNFIILKMNDVEHPSMHLFHICVSSLIKRLFKSLAHFFIGLFLSFESLHIFWVVIPSSYMLFANIFLQSMVCLCMLFNSVFLKVEVLNFDEV